MKKIFLIIGMLIFSLISVTCNKLVFREVTCRDFTLNEENYWFPINNGDSVIFTNSSNLNKIYIVEDKSISHRTKYI